MKTEVMVDERLAEAMKQFAENVKDILRESEPKGFSMEYVEYLKSAEWQAKRNERLRIDNYTCQRCGGKRDLQVHHLTYANIGHEDVHSDLITMCKDCHEDIEKAKRKSARPQDFVLREVKRLEDIETRNPTHVMTDEEKEALREQSRKRKWNKIKNTHDFLEANKSRDIGFGGRENLCNIERLTKAIEDYGLTREEVNFSDIQYYFTYHRWIRVRILHSNGLTIAEIAKVMGWKWDKVRKVLTQKGDDYDSLKTLELRVRQIREEYLSGIE